MLKKYNVLRGWKRLCTETKRAEPARARTLNHTCVLVYRNSYIRRSTPCQTGAWGEHQTPPMAHAAASSGVSPSMKLSVLSTVPHHVFSWSCINWICSFCSTRGRTCCTKSQERVGSWGAGTGALRRSPGRGSASAAGHRVANQQGDGAPPHRSCGRFLPAAGPIRRGTSRRPHRSCRG